MALPEGHFRAVVEEPRIAQSGKSGTPCFAATVRITEDGPHKGMRLPWEGWLTDGAGERSVQSMMYAGCKFEPLPGTEVPNLKDFTGCGSQEIEAVIAIESYTPEASDANPNPKESKRAKVEFINPIGGSSRKTKDVDEDTATMIANNFAGLVTKVKTKNAERAAKRGDDTSFNPKELGGSGNGNAKKLY